MAFQGFGKNSGPAAPPQSQPAFGFPAPFSAAPSHSVPPGQSSFSVYRSSHSVDDTGSLGEAQSSPSSYSIWGNQSKFPSNLANSLKPQDLPLVPSVGTYDSGRNFPSKHANVQAPKQTRSPPIAYTSEIFGEDSPLDRNDTNGPLSAHSIWGNQSKIPSNMANSTTQEHLPLISSVGTYDSGRNFQAKHADVQAPKLTRSPPIAYTSEIFGEDSPFDQNDSKRPSLSPPRMDFRSSSRSSGPESRSHRLSPPPARVDAEAAKTKSMNFPAPKRTRSPSLPSSDQIYQGNSYSAEDDDERESQAKAKRLARFKDELSQPVQSTVGSENQKVPVKRHGQLMAEKRKVTGEPADMAGDFLSGNVSSDYEGLESSTIIVGLCPDMCPESERAERERKGDLDQYERFGGDRNQTSESLAVKKYTRTAEREADLIRPMAILQKTMDYLLDLLEQPYDERFLSLYNFLWDRMRAIRMDLRMQHIFDLQAITMLEQMIRLHIIAMHELCEYTKGEGFSEGFDAHLNIEQMNKTSVELFQFYDDHRKKGIDVPTEKEFRGYYALLKLDKHPGYKVEPAELSLDLAKMTTEIRQAEEVLFARRVARACRTGNYIAFFRLARKASYLQACLMHAHFDKLRSQALASLHCSLQNNQGIPVAHIAKWLGMEDFEEPYMVKEGPFLNGDSDYVLKCSKLVHMKKSRMIVEDVSSPSLMEASSSEKVKELKLDKVYKQEPTPVQSNVMTSLAQAIDDEMPDYEVVSSPKAEMQVQTVPKTSGVDRPLSGNDHQMTTVSPLAGEISVPQSSLESPEDRAGSAGGLMYNTLFRNSLEKNMRSDVKKTPLQTMPENVGLGKFPVLQLDYAAGSSLQQPVAVKDLEDDEHAMQEVDTHVVETSCYDEEVTEAKLKLILRVWRRRSLKKKELRKQKQLAASAALSSLSLGPLIQHYNEQPSPSGEFNINHVMNERYEKHERSWSRLNISEVIAANLGRRNPDAKALCWKLILCSQMDDLGGDRSEERSHISHMTAGQWVYSKLMPARDSGDDDLLISSPGLSIWKKWVHDLSDGDSTCCLSVIKDANFNKLNDTVAGASAILFLVSDCISWELQKSHLHNLLMSIPSGSSLPLLILCGSSEHYSDPSSLANLLGLHEVDKSRVSTFLVAFLIKNMHTRHLDGFFSDEQLREGLQWLASESPLQPVLRSVKTRELVLTYMNPLFEVLDKFNPCDTSLDQCISAYNEALDGALEEVATAAKSNPACWPCPEISLLEESSDEYRVARWYLPTIGWSAAARIEPLICALRRCKLPTFSDDTSWLFRGADMGNDINHQILRLEDCLIRYLTKSSQTMGLWLAEKEAHTMVQKCCRLELHNSTYYIVPVWVMIFRRIFNWRIMNLSTGPFSTAYVLDKHNFAITASGGLGNAGPEGDLSSPNYLIQPSLDEMIEVGRTPFMSRERYSHYEAFQSVPTIGMAPTAGNIHETTWQNELRGEEERALEHELAETNNGFNRLDSSSSESLVATKATNEADRLSKLLEKCNIVQSMIDKKLSIYF
ncbi:hypothetical protein RJ640_016369 [Escallonia rubra]|uniref:PCI domain-containing protein n=1 Tax=Escallonia rubra TaxID=112253 RepID=A0AA88R7N8_9ASTE|nr:hypothetical protein RJ640_016369 [Escallonia rubra]